MQVRGSLKGIHKGSFKGIYMGFFLTYGDASFSRMRRLRVSPHLYGFRVQGDKGVGIV